jgi:hypothetical protein
MVGHRPPQEVAMEQNRYWDFRECRWVHYAGSAPRVAETPPVPLPRDEAARPPLTTSPPEAAPPAPAGA